MLVRFYTILPDKPAILYTGGDIEDNQLQILAFPKDSSDPYLKEWVKYPKTNGKWRVVIGTQQGDHGSAALFTSEDLLIGPTPVILFAPLKCDDVKHVLKISLAKYQKEMYTLGRYDTDNDIYIPDEGSVESHLGDSQELYFLMNSANNWCNGLSLNLKRSEEIK
ncbi:Fructan 6-exohydrolase [Bienertia sinuspersici]